MDADFDGAMEDVAPNEESDEDADPEEDGERLQQEMGDVGEQGETVDERLWNEEDKPEEGQEGPEKFEKDAPVQVRRYRHLHDNRFPKGCLAVLRFSSAWVRNSI